MAPRATAFSATVNARKKEQAKEWRRNRRRYKHLQEALTLILTCTSGVPYGFVASCGIAGGGLGGGSSAPPLGGGRGGGTGSSSSSKSSIPPYLLFRGEEQQVASRVQQ